MNFPLVTRHAFDTLTAIHIAERQRYDALLHSYMQLRAQGQAPISPKIPPQPADPETRYAKAAEDTAHDPWVQEMLAKGYTLEDTLDIRKGVQDDFQAGEM